MSLVAARVNGVPTTAVDVADRGLFYGDGIFRTIRVVNGQPRCWRYHWVRLAHDCRHLDLPVPDEARLRADIDALFPDRGDGIAKVVLTRGVGGRGYTPPTECEPQRMALRYPAPGYPDTYARAGVAVGIAATQLARQPALAGVKHLNRLEQVLARRECAAHGWPEALMGTDDGRVISGTMSNLFAAFDGRLATPRITDAGVLGATRACLISAFARQGYIVNETDLFWSHLRGADEVFVCNSAMPVWPVASIHGEPIPAGVFAGQARAIIESDDG